MKKQITQSENVAKNTTITPTTKAENLKVENAKVETPKQKSIAELIEEQKAYFEHKNDILRKLAIFEKKGNILAEALQDMEEEEQNTDIFSEEGDYKMTIIQGYNNDICTIKTPVVIKDIISAVLVEIGKNRKSLENDLLSK